MPANTHRRYHWTAEDKAKMAALYDQEWSIDEVARTMGCTRETVRYHLLRVGKKLRGTGMRTARSRAKWSGANHGNWKGGRVRAHGYVLLLMPDHPAADRSGYYPEHRYVVERHLLRTNPQHPALDGTSLRKDWVVHHKNGKKDDNRPKNLEALPRGQHHSWIHYQQEAEQQRAEIARLQGLLNANGIDY